MANELNGALPPTQDEPGEKKGGSGRSLRPPTLMIDLLFGALMLFAFQMGYVGKTVVPHDIELPSTATSGKAKKQQIVTLVPLRAKNGNWKFRVSGGRVLNARQVKEESLKNKQTPVMIFSHTTDLQTYLEAEQELRRHGLKPGLAVQSKKGKK